MVWEGNGSYNTFVQNLTVTHSDYWGFGNAIDTGGSLRPNRMSSGTTGSTMQPTMAVRSTIPTGLAMSLARAATPMS